MKLDNFTDYIRVSALGALMEGTPAIPYKSGGQVSAEGA